LLRTKNYVYLLSPESDADKSVFVKELKENEDKLDIISKEKIFGFNYFFKLQFLRNFKTLVYLPFAICIPFIGFVKMVFNRFFLPVTINIINSEAISSSTTCRIVDLS